MGRASALMPVQVVTAIMSLAMTPLALVVVLVALDYAEGSEFTPLVFFGLDQPNPPHRRCLRGVAGIVRIPISSPQLGGNNFSND